MADTAGIESTFKDYQAAILSRDSDSAFELINRNTRKYYEDMLANVRYAIPDEIDTMSLIDKLMVALSRQRLSIDQIKAFNGEGYFKHAVSEGWIGREATEGANITNIVVVDDSATSQFVNDGKVSPFGFSFSLEDKSWKIDLVSIFPVSNLALQHTINNAGVSVDEAIAVLIQTITGKSVDSTLWDPPLSR